MNPVIVEKIAEVERQRNQRRFNLQYMANQAVPQPLVSPKPSPTVTRRITKFFQRTQRMENMVETAKKI